MTHVYSYKESSAVAGGVGKFILDAQNEALQHDSHFKVAVSGGSMGKVLKAALIDSELKSQIRWEKWQVYFSDERLVALDNDDSNYKQFQTMVLNPLLEEQIPGPTTYTIAESLLHADGATDEEIAKEYESLLPQKLHLALLGCGPDGHTCSLFPGHSLLHYTASSVAVISDSPKPPSRRITLTLPYLAKADKLAFIAEGESKVDALKKIFGNEKSNLPCEIVNELGVPTSWFVNDAAITGVPVTPSKY